MGIVLNDNSNFAIQIDIGEETTTGTLRDDEEKGNFWSTRNREQFSKPSFHSYPSNRQKELVEKTPSYVSASQTVNNRGNGVTVNIDPRRLKKDTKILR